MKFLIIGLVFILTSCSFFNNKTADLAIASNPSGATIIIQNQIYGQTPAILKLKPGDYEVSLLKNGYGSAKFRTQFWLGTIRTDINDKITADGNRCLLDMLSIVFFFNAFTEYCSDFKQKNYQVNLMLAQ